MDAVDVGSAVGYIAACKNFDGGFGVVPGAHGVSPWPESWPCRGIVVRRVAPVPGPPHGDARSGLGVRRHVVCSSSCMHLRSNNVNGSSPVGTGAGTESHAGQIFVCVAALHIAGPEAMKIVDSDVLSWWCVGNVNAQQRLHAHREQVKWCVNARIDGACVSRSARHTDAGCASAKHRPEA